MDVDGSWEYNAPQFVDFTQPLPEDHNVEDYFNFDHESESGTPVPVFDTSATIDSPQPYKLRSNTPKRNTPKRQSTPLTPTQALKDSNSMTPRRSLRIKNTPKAEAQEKENLVEVDEPLIKTSNSSTKRKVCDPSNVPSNICTSLEEWNKRKGQAQEAQQQPNKAKPKLKRATSFSKVSENTKAPVMNLHSKTQSKKTGIERTPTSPKAATRKLKRSSSAVSLSNKPSSGTRSRQNSLERPVSQQTQRNRKNSIDEGFGSHRATRSINAASGRHNPAAAQGQDANRSLPSHRRSLSAQRQSRTRSATNTHSRSLSMEGRKRDSSLNGQPKEEKKSATQKPKLTIPVTPAVLLRPHQAPPTDMKTAEQREMEEIKRLRKELAMKRKKAEESHKKVLTSSSYAPIKSVQAPTKAEEFMFATDSRLKGSTADSKKTKDHETDFVASLRKKSTSHSPKSNLSAPKRTIPAPFHFHEDKKRKRDEEDVHDTKFQSMAEQLQNYSKKTPDRFRRKPTNKDGTPTKKKSKQAAESKLTIPKTPNFETKGRLRPISVVSQAEIEAKELEEIRKYRFKANPVNDKILKHAGNLPRVPQKEPTVFDSFNLETNRRLRDRKLNKSQEEEQSYEFHANPVPSRILEGKVGVKEPVPIPLTKPESPAFALKNRLRSFKQQVEETQPAHSTAAATRSKPVPHLGIPFQPKLDHRHTEVQAFSFENRDRTMMKKKEEKIQKVFEEEKKMREFHANPLPSDLPDSLPPKKMKMPTVAEPFQLEVDHRGSQKAEEWGHRLNEELKQQRQQASFRAKPASTLYKQPFVPKKSTKNLTDGCILAKKNSNDHSEFELHTERRHERWAELDRYKHEKEVEHDLQQRENERRRQEEEEREVRRLRKAAVHRATGIRQYKAVEIRSSDLPLTLPETPRFSERLKSRAQKS